MSICPLRVLAKIGAQWEIWLAKPPGMRLMQTSFTVSLNSSLSQSKFCRLNELRTYLFKQLCGVTMIVVDVPQGWTHIDNNHFSPNIVIEYVSSIKAGRWSNSLPRMAESQCHKNNLGLMIGICQMLSSIEHSTTKARPH